MNRATGVREFGHGQGGAWARGVCVGLVVLAACGTDQRLAAPMVTGGSPSGGGTSAGSGGAEGTGGALVSATGGSAFVATGGRLDEVADASMDAAPPDAGPPAPQGPHGPYTQAQLQAQQCEPTRAAFTYKASSGDHTSPTPAPAGGFAPIPCAHFLVYGASEPSLVVDSKGTVYYGPVFTDEGSGLVKSADLGLTWEPSIPPLPNGGKHGRVQPYLYLDPDTDRLLYASMASSGINSPAAGGLNLSVSKDGADGWQYYANVTPQAIDWVKFFAGPPVTSQTSGGYPNVIYASAPAPISTPVPVVALVGVTPQYQQIQKSLDGGQTWQEVARPSLLPTSVPGCAATEWVIMGNGVVDSSGVAYQIFRRCDRLAINKSTDEGSTWQVIEIPEGTLPPFDTTNLLQIVANPNILVTELLTVDSQDNLYVAWVDRAGRLRFVYSKDAAQTWSTPVTIHAPAVTQIRYAGVAVKEPGTFAVAYYGSRDGFEYHGYVAETENAFDAAPTFWSVAVNPPDRPLHTEGFEVGYLGILNGADLNEIVHVKYAPNGDLWASFIVDHCKGVLLDDCGSWSAADHADSPYQAVVGRVIHGVADSYSEAPAYQPPTELCSSDESSKISACRAVAQAENICPALEDCFCGNCACEMLKCEQYPDCQKVRNCALQNNCRGLDCIFACGDIAYGAGEWMTTLALDVADCGTANSCPTACPLFP